MLTGTKPSETAERALDIALILHADHELNASTFAARVVAATLSDMHSAVTAAIGALKGPLHGGANEAIFHILQDIDKSATDPVEYVKGMLAQKKKIPGFGHRVYHTEDPRATHLRKMSEDLGKSSGQTKWFEMSRKIEQFVKAEKKLNANVDFYSASTYHILGIDVDLFTPVFAVSRISGWAAHVIEQLDDNRLIRPRADYIGPTFPQRYVPIEPAVEPLVILSGVTASRTQAVTQSKDPYPRHTSTETTALRRYSSVTDVGVFRLHQPIRVANGPVPLRMTRFINTQDSAVRYGPSSPTPAQAAESGHIRLTSLPCR